MEYKITKPDRCGKKTGTSLLELLIYIAILSGLMVVISNAFILLSKGRGQSQARNEVSAAIRFATEKIRQDVKGASIVSMPTVGVVSSTLTVVSGGKLISYTTLAGQLRRSEAGALALPVTGSNISVSTPSFTRVENISALTGATTTAIQVAITMRYNATSTDWTYSDSLRTTITLR